MLLLLCSVFSFIIIFILFVQKRFKRLKRIQAEESDDEREEERGDERDAVANELFEGSDHVSCLFFVSKSGCYCVFMPFFYLLCNIFLIYTVKASTSHKFSSCLWCMEIIDIMPFWEKSGI